MATYYEDRKFTDYVHQNLARPIIYTKLGWTELNMDAERLHQLDLHHGIDYVAITNEEKKIGIQERFRESKYVRYNDFTLRYRRDHHAEESRHQSEYFKVKADFMIYGICNGLKLESERNLLTGFLKFAVIDLKLLFQLVDEGVILLDKGPHFSTLANGKLISPIKENHDKSSSFVAFDILQLQQLNPSLIKLQFGFF